MLSSILDGALQLDECPVSSNFIQSMHHASANAERCFSDHIKIKEITSAAVRRGWKAGRDIETRIAPKRRDDTLIFFVFSWLCITHQNGRGARVVSLLSTNVAYCN
jgi:hypothetical protein